MQKVREKIVVIMRLSLILQEHTAADDAGHHTGPYSW